MALKFKPQAQADLDEIWLTIAKDGVLRADAYLDSIFDTCRMLGDFPETGAERDFLPVGIRFFPHEKYNIYYQKLGRDVQILRVRHAAMDPTNLLINGPE